MSAAEHPSARQSPAVPPESPTAVLDAPEADERRALAARMLVDALLLGVVGDALLRVESWGANMALWSGGMVVALLTLARRRYDTIGTETRWLAIAAIALSVLFAWRDSGQLAAYNTLALLGTISLIALTLVPNRRQSVLTSRVRDVVYNAVRTGVGTAFGMLPLVLSDVSLRDVKRSRGASQAIAVLRAALIAIPLLLVFGALFASADPVFARLAGDLLIIDPEEVASHLVITGVIACLVGGFLRTTLLSSGEPIVSLEFPNGALGLTEVAVALGSLVLLFASFVGVQLRYFFGGDALVQLTPGLNYADYARRGFFELVTVSALVLPVLLSAGALLRRDTPRAERVYRLLASALIALLAVIMYSAFARMRLYQSVFGLSADRLYATVFMGWLAVVFAWFAMTVLRGRDRRFVGGVFLSGWGTLIALNVADPAGLVARANVARAATGKELDVSYIQSLGADAAPALAAYIATQPLTAPAEWAAARADSLAGRPFAAPSAPQRDGFTARCVAARHLLSRWGPEAAQDWRSWTVGRRRAIRAVAAHEAALRTAASFDPPGRAESCPQPPTPPPNGTASAPAPSPRVP